MALEEIGDYLSRSGILEEVAVSGSIKDFQLRIGNRRGKAFRVGRRGHLIVRPVENECRRCDVFELIPGVVRAAGCEVEAACMTGRRLIEEGASISAAFTASEEQGCNPVRITAGQVLAGPSGSAYPSRISCGSGA